MNVAVTDVAAFKLTLHLAVPLHAPDHFANVEPDLGVAVSVTAVPVVNVALHVDVQLMPAGLLATVPAPPPACATVSLTVAAEPKADETVSASAKQLSL